ncbi:early nodulin-like protein 9 [Artemisia annua]|uniref:Early nodulin-like protein 9 n=1 Tax=Artemisia annua TaxID=35608 RepID=A0A2U1QEB2_ARTAN|nr:early nodulin-like protein 9 [Artemisia annua]
MAKSMVFMSLLSLVLLIHNIDASNEFLVESTTCNQLNEKSRLQFGDTIAYVYEVEKSLVVKIRQEDYIICNAPSPIDATKSNDGYSVVKLNQTGPRYSISGIVENNNDKIIIHVIAGQRRSPTPPPQAQTLAISETLSESSEKKVSDSSTGTTGSTYEEVMKLESSEEHYKAQHQLMQQNFLFGLALSESSEKKVSDSSTGTAGSKHEEVMKL